MNKEQFLQALQQELGAVPQEERDAIIADYEEHFRIAFEKGRTEQEIIKALGSPKAIARAFLAERYWQTAANAKSGREQRAALFRAILTTAGLGLFNAIFMIGVFFEFIVVIFILWGIAAGMYGGGLFFLLRALTKSTPFFLDVNFFHWCLSIEGIVEFFVGIGTLGFANIYVLFVLWVSSQLTRLIISYSKVNVNIVKNSYNGSK